MDTKPEQEKLDMTTGEVLTVEETEEEGLDEVAQMMRQAESQIIPAETASMASLATKESILKAVDRALARVDAVHRIKLAALSATNKNDWIAHADENDDRGRPYLQTSGCEKILHMFEVELQAEPAVKVSHAEDGTYEYVYNGQARALFFSEIWHPITGSRWSGDGFFTKGNTVRPDPGDVRKAALTSFYNRAIKTTLGLRNITWEDLEKFAGIKASEVAKITHQGGRRTGRGATTTGISQKLSDGPHIDVWIDFRDKTSQQTIKQIPQDERTFDGRDGRKCWMVAATKKNLGTVMDLVATGRGVRFELVGTTEDELT